MHDSKPGWGGGGGGKSGRFFLLNLTSNIETDFALRWQSIHSYRPCVLAFYSVVWETDFSPFERPSEHPHPWVLSNNNRKTACHEHNKCVLLRRSLSLSLLHIKSVLALMRILHSIQLLSQQWSNLQSFPTYTVTPLQRTRVSRIPAYSEHQGRKKFHLITNPSLIERN